MKVNLKLLKRLYLINRPSENEARMISYLINYIRNIPKCHMEVDDYGNLFVTKNTSNPSTYPLVIAHTDAIFDFKGPREIVVNGDIITARYLDTKFQCGLTADDANGILCALQLLETLPNLKVLFTVEEECGGHGAHEACKNYDFFESISFMLQADRRGTKDLIVHTNGIDVVSEEFIADIAPIAAKYDYDAEYGTFTDVGILVEALEISGVNISCGYNSEHTSNESCSISGLQKCLNFMYEILITLQDNNKIYYVEIPEKYVSNITDDALVKLNEYPEDSYGIPCDYCKDYDCMNCTKVKAF